MHTIVTLHDVRHWTACRSVILHPGTVLTSSARQWLAEHQVAVQIADADQNATGERVGQPMQKSELSSGEVTQDKVIDREPVSVPQGAARETDLLRDDLQADASGDAAAGMQRAIITVLGKDRVGIIARVTSLLAAAHVNILDINQTLFGDLFSMNMAVDISAADVPFAELKAAVEDAGVELQVKVLMQRRAVFDYMHRV
ncbi:MAG: ACT domain-containing protein [Limnochordia bacterium]|jgi:ACT domain-containing protein